MEPSDNSQAVNNNQMSNQTSEVTLMLVLPKDASKDGKKKPVKTRLDVLVQDLVNKIIEEHGFEYINLICEGKILSPDKRLDEQAVKNHSTIKVVKVTDSKLKLQVLQRAQKGLQILCERDGIKDPWTPFLEITDQWGNSLTIPDKERKALILALGFHEKGRSLMKKKDYDYAVCHLERAEEEFRRLDPSIQTAVDNFAVLQLDIVWCQRALKNLKNLKDVKERLNNARRRLQTAEECFLGCYGKEYERLRMIKGDAGIEKAQVLLLRFYLLQSLLFYLENNNVEAQANLTKVESLYSRLVPDSDKISRLMVRGFTDTEARLALRACRGDLQEAVKHVINRRQQREEVNHNVPPVFPPFTSFNSEEVSDVLKNISRHEEDYLDLTLEEELEFINEMKTYLNGDGDGSHVTQ